MPKDQKIKITKEDKVQMEARSAKDWYDDIWKNVGKCVFCDLKEKYVLDRKDGMVLTTNIYPYIDGNLMIVPERHVLSLKELNDKEWEAVKMFHYVAKKFLRITFGYKTLFMLYREGAWLGETSQKTVHHLHIHLLPYLSGLVNFDYQEIKYPPRVVAEIYKKNIDELNKIKKRYEKKYG